MNTKLSEKLIPVTEQIFILPGRHTWQEFKTLQAFLVNVPGVRIFYLDGCLQLMTIGEKHEFIKTLIGFLLEIYFCEKEIEFIPVGSATRESEEKQVSFEPDESYYLGNPKEVPDICIEVNLTSGNINKLEKYKRFSIPEVWFWENNQILVYRFRGEDYEKIPRSEFLPDLDLDLLVRCILMPSRLEARREFLNGIHQPVS